SSWLAQANHVFSSLGICSNVDDYALFDKFYAVVVDLIQYRVTISEPRDDLPPGYLFLCPLTDLKADLPTSFRLPECLAYWSLNPSGGERLSWEEAKAHSFPELSFRMDIVGKSWDSSVYDGLRPFHEAKGFDPYNQDVAMELGLSLVEVSGSEQDAQASFLYGKSRCPPMTIYLDLQ
ncbi:hypothetical protein DFH06DRAFT_1010939, partial [Mycena polygramma]